MTEDVDEVKRHAEALAFGVVLIGFCLTGVAIANLGLALVALDAALYGVGHVATGILLLWAGVTHIDGPDRLWRATLGRLGFGFDQSFAELYEPVAPGDGGSE